MFDDAFGSDLKQSFGGHTDNRKGYGFDTYGEDESQNSETKPLESPPTDEKKNSGFFGGSPFGSSFGSFGFGNPFGSDSNNQRQESNSNHRSSNISDEPSSDIEGSGIEPNDDSYHGSNGEYEHYNYENEQSHEPETNEFYEDHEYYHETNSVDNNEGSGAPALFPLAGTHSFSDFGDGEPSANAIENYNSEVLTEGKLDYPNGDITSGSDNGVTPQSFVAPTASGFTKGQFGFGTTQTPHIQGSSGYGGQNYQYNSNNDANSFDGFTGADLNHPTTVSNDGGSGFPNFSFKKRNLPETLHESPNRKQSRFYPIPNGTENEEKEQEKPAFATVIGGALPNFRGVFGSFR